MHIKYILNSKTDSNDIHISELSDELTLAQALVELRRQHGFNDNYHGFIPNIKDYVWGKYSFKDLLDENDSSLYLNLTLRQLEDEFEISSRVADIHFKQGIGGAAGEYRGIKFFFGSDEKQRHGKGHGHIHCQYGDITYRIDLEDLVVIDKVTFKNPKMNKIAMDLVRLNQEGLKEYWNNLINKGIHPNFKMVYEIEKGVG